MKKYRGLIIASVFIIFVLVFAFFGGGNYNENVMPKQIAIPTEAVIEVMPAPTVQAATPIVATEKPTEAVMSPMPTATVQPVVTEVPVEATPETLMCTIEINCITALDFISDTPIAEIIPKDGIILSEKKVEFTEGESVFDILYRVARENGIHFEFEKTPAYNSVYIEGIGNLYEMDCGDLSGWMFRINGKFSDVGCSNVMVSSGDKIEWLYSCNMGADLGR